LKRYEYFRTPLFFMKGVTIVELLIVIAVGSILAAAGISIYGNLQGSVQLNETSSEIIQLLRIAKARSEARLNSKRHGVYLEINLEGNDKAILYQGLSYTTRDQEHDRTLVLDGVLSISTQDFSLVLGDDVDINFSLGLGMPDNTGTMTITHSVDGMRVIGLNVLGMAEEQ